MEEIDYFFFVVFILNLIYEMGWKISYSKGFQIDNVPFAISYEVG